MLPLVTIIVQKIVFCLLLLTTSKQPCPCCHTQESVICKASHKKLFDKRYASSSENEEQNLGKILSYSKQLAEFYIIKELLIY